MLRFRSNEFVILQVSDPQDLHHVRPAMLRMLDAAYDTVKPDLVVFTGDNILGNHLRDARFGTRHTVHTKAAEYARMKTAISHICRGPEARGIPFTMIYGNHDDMNEVTKEEQAALYREYPHFIGLNDAPDAPDVDTFYLPIMDETGQTPLFYLWFFDSAWYDHALDRCFTAVKREAVAWYERESEALLQKNGKNVPGIAFQHIPVPEARALMKPCPPGTPGAVRLNTPAGARYFVLDPEKAEGWIGEPIDGCGENFGEFDAMRRRGNILALVTGHEHLNSYVASLGGIRLIQTPGASFRCYGDRSRGVRVLRIHADAPQAVETQVLSYDMLCGTGLRARLGYLWDADGEEKKKAALIGAAAAAGGAAAAAVCRLVKERRK